MWFYVLEGGREGFRFVKFFFEKRWIMGFVGSEGRNCLRGVGLE